MTERTPALSLVFGYGPALAHFAFGAAAWLAPAPLDLLMLAGGRVWGAAILLFLAGVRRGLSFFTPGGPRPIQIATSFWLFGLGLAALLLPQSPALLALVAGFLSVALLDPLAARRGEVPDHFRRLRPPQMTIFLVGTALLLLR